MCQKAPSARRRIKTGRRNTFGVIVDVRKHRAPKGALRLSQATTGSLLDEGQKAPSTKRCIKTIISSFPGGPVEPYVRKHRTPKGALRQADLAVQLDLVGSVRKQRAPKGLSIVECGWRRLGLLR